MLQSQNEYRAFGGIAYSRSPQLWSISWGVSLYAFSRLIADAFEVY